MSETQTLRDPQQAQRVAAAFTDVREGRLDEARAVFAGLMQDEHFAVDAHRGLAAVAWRRGQGDSALQLLQEAVRLDAGHADAQADLALLLMMSGQPDKALGHWQRRLELRPEDAAAWHNFAQSLAESGRLQDARPAFEKALELAPLQARSYITYARALEKGGDAAGAEAVWRRGLERCPAEPPIAIGLAQLQFQTSRLDECLETYRDGVRRMPDSAELRMGLGQLLEDFGDKSGAEIEFRKALELRPGWAMPLEALLTLLRGEAEDADLDLARGILADAQRPVEDHANIGFGLGKALDRRGDVDGAFAAWTAANQARRRQVGEYRPERTRAHVDRVIAQFSEAFVTAPGRQGLDDPRPVFIVGMPRSGTSLVEQILAAHPQAHGYGELPNMSRLARELGRYSGSIRKWPESADGIGAEALTALGQDYLKDLKQRADNQARRWLDKAPMNFFYLGLIAMAFPQARFIWCRRDPRDVGLSIYGENFGLNERHATDLAGIGQYTREHQRLMRHWQALFPDRIHPCVYEELVSDLDGQARRLVEFLELPWSDNCLRYYEDRRPVLTPSRWQVRKPIYQGAVGRWQAYAAHLQPLLEALGDEVSAA